MAVADCYDSLKSAIVSGEMKMYARMWSVALMIWMMAAPIVSFIALSPYPPATATMSIVSSVILGCIELPFFCRCFPFCIKMQERLAPLFGTRLWLRFILNLVIATIFIIIGVHAESIWYVWLTAVWLLLGGLMYLFASFRGETDEGEKDRATTRATAREMDFTSPNGLAPRPMPMTRCWQFLCCHFLAPRSRASCEQHINSLASQHLSLQVLARE
jgi:hypothetical protein